MRTESLALTRGETIRGAVAALGAWVVGFAAATVAAGFVFGSRTLSSGALFFYNAHLVPLSPVGGVTDVGGNAVVQMLGALGLAAILLPLVVLGVAGGVLAWRGSAASTRDAALAGVSVVPGYFVLSVLGAILFAGPLFGGVYRPDVLLAALLAGVVFPATGGAVGGALGSGFGSVVGQLRSRFT
jgi:hypothetical protein